MQDFITWHSKFAENRLSGRYISYEHIRPLLEDYASDFELKEVGKSVLNTPIEIIKVGAGKTHVFMWSQMHGNESTTTKALFDLLKLIKEDSSHPLLKTIFKDLTLFIVPMLNPDGAAMFTRHNANNIDLNRDAQKLSQPESKILRELFEAIKPDFCFNLHGQRTIYGFEKTGEPSVLSFLAPSANEERSVTLSRKRAMSIITSVYKTLSKYLPNQIGRYDDSYNLNCVGDTFQKAAVPTILFEAGHLYDDYSREKSREYVFLALISALSAIVQNSEWDEEAYFQIPEHQKCFCDLLIKNTAIGDLAIQYKEELIDQRVHFIPKEVTPENETSAIHAHRVVDALTENVILNYSSDRSVVESILIDKQTTITL